MVSGFGFLGGIVGVTGSYWKCGRSMAGQVSWRTTRGCNFEVSGLLRILANLSVSLRLFKVLPFLLL